MRQFGFLALITMDYCSCQTSHDCFVGIFNLRMWTNNAVSAAHLLVQSAEATLPKQKKNVATKEFKQAMVASKRRGKACRMQEC
jgi:hypothetical protein